MGKRHMKRMIIKAGLSVFISLIVMNGSVQAADNTLNAGEGDRAGLILETVKQNYLASLRMEALKTGNMVPERSQLNGPASLWMKRVKASEVNMTTNRHTKEAQVKVILDNKTYYTQNDAYAETLRKNHSLCFTRDPITNEIIDKAEAATFVDASGRVFYFESDNTFNNFIALAEQDTAYGYSEPRD